MPERPTFILGIDGATFRLMDQWLPDLPNFKTIVDSGFETELQSSTPPVTSPAWRCYATGKDPAKIGVYWWRQLDRMTKNFIGADEIPLQSKCYWEYLSDYGRSVAVIGVPLNAPPRPVNGYYISGGPFANPDDYTYPDSLSDTIEYEFGYQLHPNQYPSVDTARDSDIVSDFLEMIEQRFDVATWILEEENPMLLNLTLFYINVMQHKAWDAPEVKQLWKAIDRRLGELLERDLNILIHSDHGLHEVGRVFYINAWLKEQGYLQTSNLRDEESAITESILKYSREVSKSLGIESSMKRIVPSRILEFLRSESQRRLIDSTRFESRIDFEASRAVALPQGPVYLLGDDDEFRNELRTELLEIEDPKTGRQVLSKVEPDAVVYDGPIPDNAPDFLVSWNSGFEVKDIHAENPERVFGPPHGVLADNAQEGILLGCGPDFTDSEISDTPLLYDLAPTILHLHGCPIPADMNGKILFDIFSESSPVAESDPRTISGELSRGDEKHQRATQEVDNRLRDLGYLE